MNSSKMDLSKRIKKILNERKTKKLIRDYCISETGRHWGQKYLNYVLAFLFFSFIAFWKAASYGEAIQNLLLATIALFLVLFLFKKREFSLVIKECRNKLAERDYNRRLDKATGDEVLQILKDKITVYPAVKDLVQKNDMLAGRYENKKLAVIYRYVGEEDIVGTRDLLYILHDCRERGIKEVRVFTNGEFGKKAAQLGERYDINMKLYDGSILKTFLKGSNLYPAESEIDSILKRESEKRQRRIDVLKIEILQKNKFKNYLVYGLILFMMSWYRIGAIYWNVFFGVLLLLMAVSSLLPYREKKEEEKVF